MANRSPTTYSYRSLPQLGIWAESGWQNSCGIAGTVDRGAGTVGSQWAPGSRTRGRLRLWLTGWRWPGKRLQRRGGGVPFPGVAFADQRAELPRASLWRPGLAPAPGLRRRLWAGGGIFFLPRFPKAAPWEEGSGGLRTPFPKSPGTASHTSPARRSSSMCGVGPVHKFGSLPLYGRR